MCVRDEIAVHPRQRKQLRQNCRMTFGRLRNPYRFCRKPVRHPLPRNVHHKRSS
jgi:hypothetical protein